MTPGARVQAAIEILGPVLAGAAAERELTNWARGHRFAGSGDRRGIRDHVFDALRRLRSAAWAGGEGDVAISRMDARQVIAGSLALDGIEPGTLFNGQGHAPAPLEPLPAVGAAPDAVKLDCPDWLLPIFRDDLGDRADAILSALRHRAPVVLRTNLARVDRDALAAMLAAAGYETRPDPASPGALVVAGAPRGLTTTAAFGDGLFELQDAGSQAVVDRLPSTRGLRVLDLCAGGGGKALAIAARGAGSISAHDEDPARMRDLPVRATRVGIDIPILEKPETAAPFDAVIADVPCSGSGSWRRAPEAKWRLTPAALSRLHRVQEGILDRAFALTAPGGWIGFMTCSLLASENAQQAEAACRRNPDLSIAGQWSFTPLDGCDGLHVSVLERRPASRRDPGLSKVVNEALRHHADRSADGIEGA